jgi:hypothetical protein
MPYDGSDYTQTEVYHAILRAADRIEAHPELFAFMESGVPDCGSRGCALGWIGFELGVRPGEDVGAVARERLGVDELPFYHRVNDADGRSKDWMRCWMRSAPRCAAALRLYAEKYHGADHG